MKSHWRDEIDLDGGPDVLGEDQDGVLWVPARRPLRYLLRPPHQHRRGYWDRRLSLWRPTHWFAYLRSRRRRTLAFIETMTKESS